MRRETVFITLCVCATLIACASIIAHAGQLDPPSGPIESSYKTLDKVEARTPLSQETTPGDAASLYRITQDGSYYLTQNELVSGVDNVILVQARNVTLDLNGFTVSGSTLFGAPQRGIYVDPGVIGINTFTLKNGTIRGMADYGLECQFLTTIARLEGVNFVENGTGALLPQEAVVRDCVSYGNTEFGMVASRGTVMGSSFVENATGLQLRGGVTRDCVSRSNSADGFRLGNGGSGGVRAVDCFAELNDSAGFETEYALVTGCLSVFNDGPGFTTILNSSPRGGTPSPSTYRGNAAHFNATGFQGLGVGIVVDLNHAVFNEVAYDSTAFGDVSTLTRNVASESGTTSYTITGPIAFGPLDTDYSSDHGWTNILPPALPAQEGALGGDDR